MYVGFVGFSYWELLSIRDKQVIDGR